MEDDGIEPIEAHEEVREEGDIVAVEEETSHEGLNPRGEEEVRQAVTLLVYGRLRTHLLVLSIW